MEATAEIADTPTTHGPVLVRTTRATHLMTPLGQITVPAGAVREAYYRARVRAVCPAQPAVESVYVENEGAAVPVPREWCQAVAGEPDTLYHLGEL
jgi:hypothetical protein